MFTFLDSMQVPLILYDCEQEKYVFITSVLKRAANVPTLAAFAEKYCTEKSIFTAMIRSWREGKSDVQKKQHFLMMSDNRSMLYFEIKVTIPVYEGRRYIAFTFDDQTEVEFLRIQAETYKINQILIKTVIDSVYRENDFDFVLSKMLPALGISLNISRIHIFTLDLERQQFSSAYEWCNDNIPSQQDCLKNIPFSTADEFKDIFKVGKYFSLSDVSRYHGELRHSLDLAGIKSMVLLPLYLGDEICAVIALEDCIEQRQWGYEVDSMEIVAAILSGFIAQSRATEKIQKRENKLKLILDNFPFYIYVNDVETHEIFFANKLFRDKLGRNVEGEKCWNLVDRNQTSPCGFCNMGKVLDENGEIVPKGFTRYFSDADNFSYCIYSCGLEWFDGRKAHFATIIPRLIHTEAVAIKHNILFKDYNQ